MGMKLAYHVPDGSGGFLEFCRGLQTQLGHRVDDAALHGFQSITNAGQRPVIDDVHRIIQVSLLSIGAQRNLFDAVI